MSLSVRHDSSLQPSMVTIDSEAIWVQLHDLSVMYIEPILWKPIRRSNRKGIRCRGWGWGWRHDDMGWGNFLRVRIEVPLHKALPRGRLITMKGEPCWVPFKYEKFPRICLHYGKIFHHEDCKPSAEKSNSTWYRSWMRAEPRRKGEKDFDPSWPMGNMAYSECRREPPLKKGTVSDIAPMVAKAREEINGLQVHEDQRPGMALHRENVHSLHFEE